MREEDIHVGDTVRIRQWNDMQQEYGHPDSDGNIEVGPYGCYFVHAMRPHCGRIVTIKSIDTDRSGLREQYTFDQYCGDWTYTCNMLEPLAEAPEIIGEFNLADLYGGSI